MLSQEAEEQLKNLIKNSKKESLLPQEKEAVKSQLVSFIKKNPAIKNAHMPAGYNWYQAHFSNFVASIYAKPVLRYVSLVALVIFIGGGTVAFAAQNASPGDLLYPIKTGVSEKVLALTLFSDQAKAEYTINLAQLRLQETETAAAQDKLNDQTSAEVRLLFNDHVTDIQDRIAIINAKEDARVAIELNSQLEALLRAHAKIIDNLAGKKEGKGATAISNILSDVKNKTDQITKTRQESESKLSLLASSNARINAENKLQEASAAINEVNALILSISTNISANSHSRARADLVVANQDIAQGKTKLESKEYALAFILLQDAVRKAQEVSVYISNESRLKIQLNLPPGLLDDKEEDEQDGDAAMDIESKLKTENTLKTNILK